MSDISMVIGSWGSYNECNERALGSKWLNLSDFDSWDEIEDELKKQGFELDGIDEELFVQDIEGFNYNGVNWDYVNPKEIFELLKNSGVLDNDYKAETMGAFLEVEGFTEFEDLVNSRGENWDDDIHIYKGFDWSDYGREMFDCCGYQLDERLENFFDFESYGKYIGEECAYEYDDGIIEIIR